jgi:hypothetical protein
VAQECEYAVRWQRGVAFVRLGGGCESYMGGQLADIGGRDIESRLTKRPWLSHRNAARYVALACRQAS